MGLDIYAGPLTRDEQSDRSLLHVIFSLQNIIYLRQRAG